MDFEAIKRAAEGYRADMSRFLRDMIAIPSESCEEKGVVMRIKQELEGLQAQLEGVQAVQKAQAVDEARMAEIAALLAKFKESDLTFDDLLVRKVVETVRVESTEKLEITFKDGNRRVVELPGRK